ncbi:MAG: hypothetical protein WD045_06605 [Pirellulaceae bacterium]
MAAANRAALFTTCHKVVKKHYEPAKLDTRPILEQLIYAAILENAPRSVADTSYTNLRREYIDWNEIRVTSIVELGELFEGHPFPQEAARGVKTVLQNVFEGVYVFDLEMLKKGNQGKAISQIEQFGASPFVVGYTTQHGLGGHAIPVDRALLQLNLTLGAITDKEAQKHIVPGVERAIPKTKGIEFASIMHELAVDFQASPFSKKLRDLLLEIAPDAKERFPKRESESKEDSAVKTSGGKKKSTGKATSAGEKTTAPKEPKAKSATSSAEKPPAEKPAAGKSKSAPAKKKAPKPADKPAKSAPAKKSPPKKATSKKGTTTKSSTGLTKKKPK